MQALQEQQAQIQALQSALAATISEVQALRQPTSAEAPMEAPQAPTPAPETLTATARPARPKAILPDPPKFDGTRSKYKGWKSRITGCSSMAIPFRCRLLVRFCRLLRSVKSMPHSWSSPRTIAVGVYPIRVETPDGISNIQLLAVGTFPEYIEDESRPGALPNSNDTIETAQALPPAPLTLNGDACEGPERDVFRVQAKSGEKQVFEVEARRCGSAIDPVLEILDASGKTLARSEDAPLLGLDARVAVTFPRDGYYYVVVHDARYSTQTANFYRLKIGSYAYPQEMFPLGGRRGEVRAGFARRPENHGRFAQGGQERPPGFRESSRQPGAAHPFRGGGRPGGDAAVAMPSRVPVTINGRLAKPGAVDRYKVRVSPGEPLVFRIQALRTGHVQADGGDHGVRREGQNARPIRR